MRKTLAALVVLVTASWLSVGCSSSGGGNNGGTGGSTSGGGTGGMTSGGGTGGTTSGGGTGGSSGNCILPKTWSDNLESITSMCLPCAQANCCDPIVKCAANADCLAIYKCEQNCYEGIGPDGGVVSDSDAAVDDAGDTAMDKCVADCISNGSKAGQDLFDPQDSCVNGLLPNNCGKMEVCD